MRYDELKQGSIRLVQLNKWIIWYESYPVVDPWLRLSFGTSSVFKIDRNCLGFEYPSLKNISSLFSVLNKGCLHHGDSIETGDIALRGSLNQISLVLTIFFSRGPRGEVLLVSIGSL